LKRSAFGIWNLALVEIHLAQVGNTQGAEFIAFDIGLHQDIVGAMKQGEARSIINYQLFSLLVHSKAGSPILFYSCLVKQSIQGGVVVFGDIQLVDT